MSVPYSATDLDRTSGIVRWPSVRIPSAPSGSPREPPRVPAPTIPRLFSALARKLMVCEVYSSRRTGLGRRTGKMSSDAEFWVPDCVSGRLASRRASANRIPAVLPWSAPNFTGQSGARRVAADCDREAPRRERAPLDSQLEPTVLKRWLRRWTSVRHREAAERTLSTAIANGQRTLHARRRSACGRD